MVRFNADKNVAMNVTTTLFIYKFFIQFKTIHASYRYFNLPWIPEINIKDMLLFTHEL